MGYGLGKATKFEIDRKISISLQNTTTLLPYCPVKQTIIPNLETPSLIVVTLLKSRNSLDHQNQTTRFARLPQPQQSPQSPPLPRITSATSHREMAEPLLSSLCSICHINAPKYTCPRCSIQTCSLPCTRRHKLWSECCGVRDPTAFKPKSQLATPSGVDHDYNFLHSIEHKIERSEKRIVEDRGLVERGELAAARRDQNPDEWRVKMQKRKRNNPGQEPIERSLKMMRTTVELAPKGMKRSGENATTWSKARRTIYWQVEWVREGNAGRSLSKVMGNRPIGEAYAELLEEERKNLLTDEEKRVEKKTKAKERERLARPPTNSDGSF